MKDIDGVHAVLEILKPHMTNIDKHFNETNEYFLTLYNQPHDKIGRVLKCHLIVENFLTSFLSDFYKIECIDKLQLKFSQKVEMLPKNGLSASFVRPGIIQLNKVRNKCGHDLNSHIERQDIASIYQVLEVARRGMRFDDPVDAIEAFTPIACAFLSVPPPELQAIFIDAFKAITTYDPE
ncbi:TPA: hypothetical protein OUC63_003959 [Raoultella ornithinolytica]|uniref:hypothetical protein n=1 Tax=Klebsiella pneumoniae complex TaxID=3390273 RepID=UPI0012510343|nr:MULTISPECIES: hypothetical protein [Klebsiella]HCT9585939.1 hypothetical protein [Raoultella ornithinolytica]VAO22394.1 Uncharacterised protein [Klebsiella quasipneumoniae]GKN98482.1 hypothetical protein NUKP99_07920 [Klebsiella variicola]HCI9329078.1 hypothetical protein [Klebsiella variicola]HDW2205091.1 hypothetical protein [Klebsiella quasipneumoniae]